MMDHISICICTFRRNQMLGRLLRKLKGQDTGGLFTYSVVIVDNDASGPAKETVLQLRTELGLDIEYDIEPEQTIPAARNRTLRLARGNYIAIIDDDEFPPHDWLITLYHAIQTFDMDGALGPVYPIFDQVPPTWILRGRFCERPVYRTGTLLRWNQTRTGNVLLKKEVIDQHNLTFDLSFRTSSSDRTFFKRAMELGRRFVAVEEAPVYEIVPPERWTKSYILRRALLQGYNTYRNSVSGLRWSGRASMALKSTGAVFIYAVELPFCAILGTHKLMKCLEKGCSHLSWLLGMMGIQLIKKRDL